MLICEYTCPVCGKYFATQYPDYWVYKKQWYNKIYICCSWTCFRKLEKEMEAKQSKRGRKKGQKRQGRAERSNCKFGTERDQLPVCEQDKPE
jgi:hypothetical protein